MRKKIIILPIILSLFSLLSADPPIILWQKSYGGINSDIGLSIQQTRDGGFVIAGETNSFGAGSKDVYLIRINSNGDTLWTRTYGGAEEDYGNSVQQTSDGGFIITGATNSFGLNLLKLYLLRTDSHGDTIWAKTYLRGIISEGFSVKQTTDGGYIIAGYAMCNDSIGNQVYIIKTDAVGDTIWTKTYGGIEGDCGNSVQQTSDGGFIIAGYTSSFGAGESDVYLIRTNSNGDTVWTKTYGGIFNDYGKSVVQTADGGYVIVGTAWYYTNNLSEIYVIRTDSKGDTLWTKMYSGDQENIGYSVQQTHDYGFIIGGMTHTGANMLPGRRIYLIRTDSNGEVVWTDDYHYQNYAEGRAVQQTGDGGFIVTGWGAITSPISSGSNIVVIRLDKDSTGIQEEITTNFIKPNDFIVSYNHGNISICYTIPYSTSFKLEAYDIKGKLVSTIVDKYMNKGSYSVNWDSKRFGSGVYYVKLYTESNSMIRKAIILK